MIPVSAKDAPVIGLLEGAVMVYVIVKVLARAQLHSHRRERKPRIIGNCHRGNNEKRWVKKIGWIDVGERHLADCLVEHRAGCVGAARKVGAQRRGTAGRSVGGDRGAGERRGGSYPSHCGFRFQFAGSSCWLLAPEQLTSRGYM